MEKILGRYSPFIYAVTRIIVGMMYWSRRSLVVRRRTQNPPVSTRLAVRLAVRISVVGTIERRCSGMARNLPCNYEDSARTTGR
jgi:hypothetical protein